MKTDSISFKSKINFVTAEKMYTPKRCVYVPYYPFDDCLRKADEFFTENVRTCTAGGLFNTKTGEAVGFHYFDSKKAFENVGKFINQLMNSITNPDKCFLLGGKNLKCAPYSMLQFNAIKDALESSIGNITIFEEHLLPWSETDLHYTKENDTWNVRTVWSKTMGFKQHEVVTLEDIKTCFRNVRLSPEDEITFNQ